MMESASSSREAIMDTLLLWLAATLIYWWGLLP